MIITEQLTTSTKHGSESRPKPEEIQYLTNELKSARGARNWNHGCLSQSVVWFSRQRNNEIKQR